MALPQPSDLLMQQVAQVVESIGERLDASLSSATFRIISAIATANRPKLIAEIGSNMDFQVANPDISGGGIIPVFPADSQRWSLFAFPRGTGAVNIFWNFNASPRSITEIMPSRPHKFLFADAGPAMQQQVSAQSPGGQSGITLWSVRILRQ